MSKETLVEIEPQRRFAGNRSDQRLKKAELNDITGAETLVLATAIGQTILSGLEMKERRRMRRILLLIAGGLALLCGIARLAIQLHQS